MEDRKAGSETRAGDVLQRMRLDIINCVLKPGEKLRFETLRTMYAVSFSTLREALSRLAAENLVIAEGQRGFVVAPVSIADLNDLTNVRVLIECEALSKSVRRGDDRWEGNILATYHRMDKLQQRLGREYYLSEEWSAVHGEFHHALVSACASPVLLEIRSKLFERAHRYRRMSSQFRPYWREKGAEHKMIVDAALDRDEENALRLIEQHIRETTENVIEHAGHLFPELKPVAPKRRKSLSAAE
ncbi:FCD domain-containing protein [Rhizobium sp. CNPSo 3464]|uniref:GntR family transcriptional regulator n=1 Tax=Rhizobium sp. CNPSo 3464 TaxID=3021406 RepID=UPI00254E23A8|nr:FCD domain-containing protein [Rhizobium sp. CNPSo 3464]MDK4740251.1 FCD domain-containing protein [Rhizobium sp. CNPSo 3464]